MAEYRMDSASMGQGDNVSKLHRPHAACHEWRLGPGCPMSRSRSEHPPNGCYTCSKAVHKVKTFRDQEFIAYHLCIGYGQEFTSCHVGKPYSADAG